MTTLFILCSLYYTIVQYSKLFAVQVGPVNSRIMQMIKGFLSIVLCVCYKKYRFRQEIDIDKTYSTVINLLVDHTRVKFHYTTISQFLILLKKTKKNEYTILYYTNDK